MDRKNVWTTYNASQLAEVQELGEKYKRCLDEGNAAEEKLNLSVYLSRFKCSASC